MVKAGVFTVKGCRFDQFKRPQHGSRYKCYSTYQMYYMLYIVMVLTLSDASWGTILEFLVAFSGFLHSFDGVLQVLLQPRDLWVHTHFFVWLQLSNHLEGAVGRVDEPELSDVASWEAVDRGTTVASLHQADRLCLWWRRIYHHHERSQECQQLHIHSAIMSLRFDPAQSKVQTG